MHFVWFIICLFIIFLFEMSSFLQMAPGCSLSAWKTPKALTMMNMFKLCSTCLQKSPFGSTSKAFFSSPAQWYIHASSHYSEIWSITLLEPTTIQSKTLCFICYYLLFFLYFFLNAFSSDLFVVPDAKFQPCPARAASLMLVVSACRARGFPGGSSPSQVSLPKHGPGASESQLMWFKDGLIDW